MLNLPAVVLVLSLALVSHDAFAKRLGGGASVGKQPTSVSQRANPAQVAPDAAKSAQPVSTAAAAQSAAATRQPSRWGGMLGGLAAGLGLAWLASSLGLGEGFAQLLLVGVLAAVVLVVAGALWRARRGVGAVPAAGLAYQGAGRAGPLREYSPNNVGNDASARPWEHGTPSFEAAAARYPESGQPSQGSSLIGSALGGASWGIPADFDVVGFLAASKTNFIGLQAAWDRADIPSLRAMMTDGMLAQIKAQLAEHERTARGNPNVTEVVMLEARLLGIEDVEGEHMASVEFSGLIREDPSSGPSPFREVWSITRPVAGPGGWLVAGVQALQ